MGVTVHKWQCEQTHAVKQVASRVCLPSAGTNCVFESWPEADLPPLFDTVTQAWRGSHDNSKLSSYLIFYFYLACCAFQTSHHVGCGKRKSTAVSLIVTKLNNAPLLRFSYYIFAVHLCWRIGSCLLVKIKLIKSCRWLATEAVQFKSNTLSLLYTVVRSNKLFKVVDIFRVPTYSFLVKAS